MESLRKMKSIAFIISVVMIVAACFAMPVNAENGDQEESGAQSVMSLGTGVLAKNVNTGNAQKVAYGWFEDEKSARLWHVIGYDGKGVYSNKAGMPDMTLFSKGALAREPFSKNGTTDSYAESDIKKRIEDDVLPKQFAAEESTVMIPRNLSDVEVDNAVLWPLSSNEADMYSHSGTSLSPELASFESPKDQGMYYWWLRTPGSYDPAQKKAKAVIWDGRSIDDFAVNYNDKKPGEDDNYFSVRPAFNLGLDSVIFTSAAKGGKLSGEVGRDALCAPADTSEDFDNIWKLTLKDEKGRGNFAAGKVTAYDGKTLTIEYSGAKTGENEFISAIITDKDAENIKYYGRLRELTAADMSSGEVKITVADKLGENDRLWIFNEQFNGDDVSASADDNGRVVSRTDFASELKEIPAVCRVQFTDGLGHVLKDSPVVKGTAAVAPADPERGGYTFKGWDKDYSNIQKDTVVTAVWEKLKFTTPLIAVISSGGKNSVKASWKEVKNADGYDVFFARCKTVENTYDFRLVSTLEGSGSTSWKKGGLKTKTAYKIYIKAYVMEDGVKRYVRKSPTVHAFTSGSSDVFTNPKSLKLRKSKVTLKKGKSYTIKASIGKVKRGRKLISTEHAPKLRYISSDEAVASVSKSGKIKAVAAGSCKIYVITVNGLCKTVKLTVKK